MMLMVLDP